ncbi:TetR/AcrR family transcriptional regulator [Kitasatospora sp. NPDC047058]|uniref:TetR/AcrR family transcriptional regulator n=1 Tax=Kitasatospora sp. NPDC047058 TaxID=3155620 RepID=UPI00340875E6
MVKMVKQKRAAHTRQALLVAAGEEFATEGFDTVSLARIAKRAGVSYGGLHYHFNTKQDLAAAVVAEAATVLRDEVCAPGSLTSRNCRTSDSTSCRFM